MRMKQAQVRTKWSIGPTTPKPAGKSPGMSSSSPVSLPIDYQPAEERRRIIQEVSILKNINHSNIIAFINAWTNKSNHELVMITQMVSGGSLRKYLAKIKTPVLRTIKKWCKQILQGLNYLHSQQPTPIIHRDIKCDNLFVNTHTNELRIGDLGLAVSTQNSYAQTFLGTPGFMAPEIFKGKYGTGVDIYAFGMSVLEMATRETPYQECVSIPEMYKLIEKRIKPQSFSRIRYQPLRNFVEKCLSDVSVRPTASELLADQFLNKEVPEDLKQIKLHSLQEIERTNKDSSLVSSEDNYYRHSQTRGIYGFEGEMARECEYSQATITQYSGFDYYAESKINLKQNGLGEPLNQVCRYELTDQGQQNQEAQVQGILKDDFKTIFKERLRPHIKNTQKCLNVISIVHSAYMAALAQIQAEVSAFLNIQRCELALSLQDRVKGPDSLGRSSVYKESLDVQLSSRSQAESWTSEVRQNHQEDSNINNKNRDIGQARSPMLKKTPTEVYCKSSPETPQNLLHKESAPVKQSQDRGQINRIMNFSEYYNYLNHDDGFPSRESGNLEVSPNYSTCMGKNQRDNTILNIPSALCVEEGYLTQQFKLGSPKLLSEFDFKQKNLVSSFYKSAQQSQSNTPPHDPDSYKNSREANKTNSLWIGSLGDEVDILSPIRNQKSEMAQDSPKSADVSPKQGSLVINRCSSRGIRSPDAQKQRSRVLYATSQQESRSSKAKYQVLKDFMDFGNLDPSPCSQRIFQASIRETQ